MSTRTETFAEALQRELRARGWSQERLAREISVSVKTIRNWLAGEMPRLDRYTRVCHALGWPEPPFVVEDVGTRV